MNRHERRQVRLGRSPVVVAMPTLGRKQRTRKVTETTKRCLASFTIDNGRETDSTFVVTQMQRHFELTGNPPITLDPTAPMLIARDKLTEKPYACLTLKPIPPGKLYVENFLCLPGRRGKQAGRALFERVMAMAVKKVCMVEARNEAMLRILEHYGGRVVGFIVEGPYTEAVGAPQDAVAAAPLEAIV